MVIHAINMHGESGIGLGHARRTTYLGPGIALIDALSSAQNIYILYMLVMVLVGDSLLIDVGAELLLNQQRLSVSTGKRGS